MDHPSLIMAAVDGSASSVRASHYAAGLARRQGARVAFIHVAGIPATIAAEPNAVAAYIQGYEGHAGPLLAGICANTCGLDLDAIALDRCGDPLAEIVRAAQELRADAIVVGRPVRNAGHWRRSLPARLIRNGTWPVTVVP